MSHIGNQENGIKVFRISMEDRRYAQECRELVTHILVLRKARRLHALRKGKKLTRQWLLKKASISNHLDALFARLKELNKIKRFKRSLYLTTN
jgi:hypothetical protein